MKEKFKNLNFPVKCGLAILTFPLVSMTIAYLFLIVMGVTRPEGGWEMGPLVPMFLLYLATLPILLLSLPFLKGGELSSIVSGLPFSNFVIFTIPPLALIPWFLTGYLIGKLASRFSPKVQKVILFFFIVAPIALFLVPFLTMIPLVLLGALLNNFWLFVLVVILGVWLVVRWIRKRR